jgi:hypothetical protein
LVIAEVIQSDARISPAYAFMPTISAAKVAEKKGLLIKYTNYADVFLEEKANELLPEGSKDYAIETEGEKQPPYSLVYNLSETELLVLRDYLQASEAKGWIRRSVSPAGAPILFVPKSDRTLRLCVDYRGLNKITIKNRYPLPLISETLDRLRGAKVFTKLDLRNAYHRIRIRKGDEWKIAFRTRYGHFEYLVMPFGLSNALATFQAYMNEILEGLLDRICVVYLDDILIYSRDPKEYTKHMRQVLERLEAYGLYIKLSKCEFDVQRVDFLRYVISTSGISIEQDRVTTIKD